MKRKIFWSGLFLICVFALACQPPADIYGTEPMVIMTRETYIKAIPEYSARNLGRLRPGQQLKLVNPVGEWYEVRYSRGQTGFVHSSVARVERKDSFILHRKLAIHAAARPESGVSFIAPPGMQVFTLRNIQYNMIYIWTKNGKGGWANYKEFIDSSKEGHLPDKLEPSAILPAESFGTWFVYEPFLITDEAGKTYSVLPGQNVLANEVSQRGYEIILPNRLKGWTPSARVVPVYGKPVITTIGTDCFESLVGGSPANFRYESGTLLMIVGYENGFYNVNAAINNNGCVKTKRGSKNLRTGYVRGTGLKPIKFQLAVVAKDRAKMRFEPQTSSAEVTKLFLGEEIICLESKNMWQHIVTGGSNKDGWVKRKNIEIPEWGYGVALRNIDINLKGPGSQYRSPLHKLERGDFVPILEKWGDGYQVPVSEKEKLGWIQTQDVVAASFRPLIVTSEKTCISKQQKGGKEGRFVRRGTELIELRQDGAYHLVTDFSWNRGYVPSEDVALMHYGKTHITTRDTLRFGPGKQYQIRPRNLHQADVSVMDYYEDWIQVDLGNNSGWIRRDINKLKFLR